MALNFPASPALNDIHTDGDYKFQWDGNKWVSIGPEGNFTEIRSPTGTNSASITDATTGGSPQPAQFDVTFGSTNALQITTTEAEFNADVSCSNIKANSIKNASTNDGGIAIDSSGHVQIDGQQLPSAGALSHRNIVINGAMLVNQTGTATVKGLGGADRFATSSSSSLTVGGYGIESSQQQDAPANTGFQKSYQVKTTAAVTANADSYVGFSTHLEFQDIYKAIWAGNSHVTFSFWVKSSITGTFGFSFNPCNVSQSSSDGNRRVLHYSNYTISAANTWEYKTITVDMATFNSSYTIHDTSFDAQVGLGAQLTWTLDVISGGNRDDAALGWNSIASEVRNFVGNSAAADTGFSSTANATFKITGVQFEIGAKATPFEHKSYAEEFERCKRYRQELDLGTSTNALHMIFHRFGASTGAGFSYLAFPTAMRAAPSFSFQGSVFDGSGYTGNPILGASTPSSARLSSTNQLGTNANAFLRPNTGSGDFLRLRFTSELF
tara:strand:+ start:4592 stop:6079 length:1488 start_codon:yes stop_codon:yes gene_type:complete